MNDLTPYERFLAGNLQNLPLPDEDMAWKEMKKLLDEKEDDRPIIPPFLKGCLPWIAGILLIGAVALIWLNVQRPASHERHGKIAPGVDSLISAINRKSNEINDSTMAGRFNSPEDINNRVGINNDQDSLIASNQEGKDEPNAFREKQPALTGTDSHSDVENSEAGPLTPNGRGSKNGASFNKEIPTSSVPSAAGKRNSRTTRGKLNTVVRKPGISSGKDQETDTANANANVKKARSEKISGSEVEVFGLNPPDKDSPETDNNKMEQLAVAETDSIRKDDAKTDDTLAVNDRLPDSTALQDSSINKKKRKPFMFAAGIAVNQQIPLDGEKPVPYDHFGRKGSLSDYIPSIYFRAMKPKWFIQGEFRYGAPNSVKEFVYSSKTSIDTFQNATTSLKTLKKTFYHQLPLTINYFVTKNWSVGVGVAYNKFTRAVRQEDVRLGIAGTVIDTLLSSEIVQDGRDTAFVSNTFQWIAETQYRWNRFSLGLRIARGLQPYIKYTDPGSGMPAEKRNQSLNAFLRYDLWRSKKK